MQFFNNFCLFRQENKKRAWGMKKFQFSLQKVLDLRQFAEDQAKTELAQAISHAELIKVQLAEIAQQRVDAYASRSNCLNIEEHIVIENFITRLDIKKESLLQELAQAELIIEEKRKIYTEAMKNRKVLSKLKEKKYAEYRKNYFKKQDEIVDDISSSRYNIAM